MLLLGDRVVTSSMSNYGVSELHPIDMDLRRALRAAEHAVSQAVRLTSQASSCSTQTDRRPICSQVIARPFAKCLLVS